MKINYIVHTLAIVTAALILTGCAMDVANRYYAPGKYPAKYPEQVEILKQNPTRPFEIIAVFQSQYEGIESVRAIRAKAAQIGADAVIISTFGGRYLKSDSWASSDTLASSGNRVSSTAIVYK